MTQQTSEEFDQSIVQSDWCAGCEGEQIIARADVLLCVFPSIRWQAGRSSSRRTRDGGQRAGGAGRGHLERTQQLAVQSLRLVSRKAGQECPDFGPFSERHLLLKFEELFVEGINAGSGRGGSGGQRWAGRSLRAACRFWRDFRNRGSASRCPGCQDSRRAAVKFKPINLEHMLLCRCCGRYRYRSRACSR